MKKLLLSLSVLLLLSMIGCSASTKEPKLTPVTLNEVVHSIFYAPQYVAIEKGFFEEEGIDLKVDVGNGADKSMTALLSGNADIALCGTEAALYIHAEDHQDPPVIFAQLTQRAGNFLVSRTEEPDFSWEDVKGSTIIGGREGGMPQIILEYILDQNGIDPEKDVEMITNLDLSATASAFAAGTGDYTVEFEPGASTLENEDLGHVAASLGVDSGFVPYTVYNTSSSFMNEHPELVQGFTNALYKGLVWCQEHTAEEIAEVIQPQFKETSLELLTMIVSRYQQQDTWIETPVMEEESLKLIEEILHYSGTLDTSVSIPYETIVNREYAEKAAK